MSTPSGLGYAAPAGLTAADPATADGPGRTVLGVPVQAWARAGVVAVLFAAVFWPNLRRLWLKTNPFTGEANWQHSCFVPLIGLYYLFLNRETLAAADVREFVWGRFARPWRLGAGLGLIAAGAAGLGVARVEVGTVHSLALAAGQGLVALGALVVAVDWSLAAMVFGLGLFVYGIWYMPNDMLKDLGMVVTLFGVVLMLCGPGVMRTAWFPIAFLVCAIPWPGLVYSWVAEPLQQLAATVAVETLKLTGVESWTSGTKIVIFGNGTQQPRVLNVAEACAGMRSLMTFISVAAALAFLWPKPLWQRAIMVASAVPIAIGCNVMRISGQGLLDHYVNAKWSESYAHQMVGLMMLVPAFLLILAVGWALDQVFIEEADPGDAPPPPADPLVIRRAGPPPAGKREQR